MCVWARHFNSFPKRAHFILHLCFFSFPGLFSIYDQYWCSFSANVSVVSKEGGKLLKTHLTGVAAWNVKMDADVYVNTIMRFGWKHIFTLYMMMMMIIITDTCDCLFASAIKNILNIDHFISCLPFIRNEILQYFRFIFYKLLDLGTSWTWFEPQF